MLLELSKSEIAVSRISDFHPRKDTHCWKVKWFQPILCKPGWIIQKRV